jgi:hypothetical protein
MISPEFPSETQVHPPTRAGATPRHARGRATGGAVAVALALVGASGACATACVNNDQNQVTLPTVLGMTSTVAPFYSDGQLTIYQVETPVTLPVRRATDAESKALGKAAPYPRAPFLLAGDLRVEIRFTLSNLDDQPRSVELLVDPWNEFVRYKPGIQMVSDEESVPDFSGFDKFYIVPAKGRVEGTITHDDTNELAVDLATAEAVQKDPPAADSGVSGNALFNHIFNLQNRSNDGDPLVTPRVPTTIAGLTGFDLGLRSYGPANVAIEIVVDVVDVNGDRVIGVGADGKPMGPPGTLLEPPAARTM